MTDKRAWTAEEENENNTLVHHYINEAYQSGVVDNFLEPYNVFNGKKLKDEQTKKNQ
ncbi:hypothetical protein GCM10011391_33700 [Pullulanibacillus camelliae]|uniref:Uncharacterized protein n=1 Tax=Pullulanibacillus camelliae TaxID=1707096 RepID=A0A8J2YKZ4_9BACL|nr:hypothetical protein [Pullulanibacillus camelliae]GGE52135.1 hypothetical protein GCM10011391_33700 [Pullulanibacillus camelliae]